jgi:hypothetical protein
MGLREDGTIRLSVADERLHGASRQSAQLSGSAKEGSFDPPKGYPSSKGVLDSARSGKFPELAGDTPRRQRFDRCDRCLRMDDGRKPPDRPQTRRTCDRSRRLVANAEKVLDYSRQLIEESQRLIKESRRCSGNAPTSEPKGSTAPEISALGSAKPG